MSAEIEKELVKQELEKLLFRSKKSEPEPIKCPKCGSADTGKAWGLWNRNCRKCEYNFNVPEPQDSEKAMGWPSNSTG